MFCILCECECECLCVCVCVCVCVWCVLVCERLPPIPEQPVPLPWRKRGTRQREEVLCCAGGNAPLCFFNQAQTLCVCVCVCVCERDRTVTPRYFWDVATGLGEDVGKKHCTGDGGFWLLRVCVYMCVYHLRGKQSYLSVA